MIKNRWILCFIIITVIHCVLSVTWISKIGSYAGNLVAASITKSFDGSKDPKKEIEITQTDLQQYAVPWMPLAHALEFPTGYIMKPLWKIVYQKAFYEKIQSKDFDPNSMNRRLKVISASNLLINSAMFAIAWTLGLMGIFRIMKTMHNK